MAVLNQGYITDFYSCSVVTQEVAGKHSLKYLRVRGHIPATYPQIVQIKREEDEEGRKWGRC